MQVMEAPWVSKLRDLGFGVDTFGRAFVLLQDMEAGKREDTLALPLEQRSRLDSQASV